MSEKMNKSQALHYCPAWPGVVPLWFSMAILLGQYCYCKISACVFTKILPKTIEKNLYLILNMQLVAGNCLKVKKYKITAAHSHFTKGSSTLE